MTSGANGRREIGTEGSPENREFPVRINRRLSFFFSLLFLLVVVVGGTSLYLARSIFLTTQEVKKESDRIDLVDRMHYTIHHVIEALERTSLLIGSVTEDSRKAYFEEITGLLRRYDAEAGAEKHAAAEFREAIHELDAASENIVKQIDQLPRKLPNRNELQALAEIEGKIQTLAHWLSLTHRAKMERIGRENTWEMQLILWLYGGFVLVGAGLILGSIVFFSRRLAQPLRLLAEGAREIAQGNLEKKVAVKSRDEIGQLSHAFNVMVDRLREHKEKLQGLATLEERERIAQELHDTLAQELVLLQMKLSEAELDLSPGASAPIRKALEEIRKIAEGAYEDVRQSIFGLRTMVSRSLGLIPTLTEYLHDYSEMRKVPVSLKIPKPQVFRFSPHVEVQLIRIVHEALTNVFKHAQARSGVVRFERDGGWAKVSIEDDGKGFLLDQPKNHSLHFGLKTMRERAEGVGGTLTIDSAPGKGTKVVVTLPLEKRENHETYPRAVGR